MMIHGQPGGKFCDVRYEKNICSQLLSSSLCQFLLHYKKIETKTLGESFFFL